MFKDQVKKEIVHCRNAVQESDRKKDEYKRKVIELGQKVELLKVQHQLAIEQKSVSRFAQLSEDTARELRTTRDEKQHLTTKVDLLTSQVNSLEAQVSVLQAQLQAAE